MLSRVLPDPVADCGLGCVGDVLDVHSGEGLGDYREFIAECLADRLCGGSALGEWCWCGRRRPVS